MKALSIRQPWAWLIIHGYKDIENRDWYTGYRGRIYVHAGKQVDNTGWDFIRKRVSPELMARLRGGTFNPISLPTGCLVGEVDLVDCVLRSAAVNDNSWFVGKYVFVLKYPERYLHPTPCRGRLGLFEVPESVRGVFSHYKETP